LDTKSVKNNAYSHQSSHADDGTVAAVYRRGAANACSHDLLACPLLGVDRGVAGHRSARHRGNGAKPGALASHSDGARRGSGQRQGAGADGARHFAVRRQSVISLYDALRSERPGRRDDVEHAMPASPTQAHCVMLVRDSLDNFACRHSLPAVLFLSAAWCLCCASERRGQGGN